MQDKIRQWLMENPRAIDAAYAVLLGSSLFVEIGLREAAGATSGP